MKHEDKSGIRRAELVACLSLASDLGMGLPMEHGLATCLLAVRLGQSLALPHEDLQRVYYLALLRRAGCTADSYELGRLFGDDLGPHARLFELDFGRPLDLIADILRHAGEGRPAWRRAAVLAGSLTGGRRVPESLFRASCEVAQSLAEYLGFDEPIREALGQTFERWDGRGFPRGLCDEQISVATRVVQVAEDAEVFRRALGDEESIALIAKRAGRAYDPVVASRFRREAGGFFAELAGAELWQRVLDLEPWTGPLPPDGDIDSGLQVMGWFADLKSPYASSHSTAVAGLAARAATEAGFKPGDVASLRRAGLVHDLGKVGVSSAIWQKTGALTQDDWEKVRLHPYYTERILARSQALRPLGTLASMHHERLDGSGYHRGLAAGALSEAAKLLAAANAYQALLEPRPHRPALTPSQASAALVADVNGGRLDAAAADAVLRAAGRPVSRLRLWPAGLTDREVQVLRLLSRGASNKQIARRLVVAEATVAAHIRHIYDKVGVTTRAAATLFAMRHELLPTSGRDET